MIKGIDTQVITQRTTNYMKENSAALKGQEFSQEMLSKLGKEAQLKQTQTIVDVNKNEQMVVRTDDADVNYDLDERGRKKKKKKQQADPTMISGEESVGYGEGRSLDIEI